MRRGGETNTNFEQQQQRRTRRRVKELEGLEEERENLERAA